MSNQSKPTKQPRTIYESLTQFQKQCPNLAKEKEGFNYKYTPLEVMLSTVQPVLHECGFALSQTSGHTEHGQATIITRLLHESGEELKSEMLLFLPENMGSKPMFAWGGSITYARRYAIKMILGIEPDMDTNTEDADSLANHQQEKLKKKTGISRTQTKAEGNGTPKTTKPVEESLIPEFLNDEAKKNILADFGKLTEKQRDFVKGKFKKEFKITAALITSNHIQTQAQGQFLRQAISNLNGDT